MDNTNTNTNTQEQEQRTQINPEMFVSMEEKNGTVLEENESNASDDMSGTSASQGDTASDRQRHLSASTRAYRKKRAALRILNRLQNIPHEQLSEKDKDSLNWAVGYIASPVPLEAQKRPNSDEPVAVDPKLPRTSDIDMNVGQTQPFIISPPSDIRQKLPETPTPSSTIITQNVKKLEPASSNWKMNTSEIIRKGSKLAIIDANKSDGAITPTNWKLIELALLKVYKSIITENSGPPPTCRDAGWYGGRVKLIACADLRSATLYKSGISKLGEVWPGAKLRAVPTYQIPHRPRCKTLIPAEPSSPEAIIEIIRLSNPELPMQDWKVVKVNEPSEHTREAVIILSDDCLSLLKVCQGCINYGFGSINLKVYTWNESGNLTHEVYGTNATAANKDVISDSTSDKLAPINC